LTDPPRLNHPGLGHDHCWMQLWCLSERLDW